MSTSALEQSEVCLVAGTVASCLSKRPWKWGPGSPSPKGPGQEVKSIPGAAAQERKGRSGTRQVRVQPVVFIFLGSNPGSLSLARRLHKGFPLSFHTRKLA